MGEGALEGNRMNERIGVSGDPVPEGERTAIPRGLEVLMKKAAIDPAFKTLLLARRAEAAATIGLALEPGEVRMLQSATAEQMEAIIARTTVPQEHRRAFLGQAAAAMLATLGTMTFLSGCGGSRPSDSSESPPSKGIRPDRPPDKDPPVTGIRPDQLPEK